MGLTCQITVKGDGVGRYGKPKADRTGPLREFLVFNQVFFKTVRDHLASCTACDPDEALRVYLDRLKSPPTKGSPASASSSALKGFQALEKAMRRAGRPVSPALLREACLMSGDANVVLECAKHCSLTELVQCYRHHEAHVHGYRLLQQLCGQDRTFAALQQILKGGGRPPPEDELRRLLEVAEVMLS